MRLGQEKIQEPAPDAGGAFDELEILRAEHDDAQHPQIIGELPHRPAIEADLSPFRRPIQFQEMIFASNNAGFGKIALLTVPGQLAAAGAAEGSQRGEEIEGFEEVGLALGVLSEQEMESRRKAGIQTRIVTEVAESESPNVHREDLPGPPSRCQSFSGPVQAGGISGLPSLPGNRLAPERPFPDRNKSYRLNSGETGVYPFTLRPSGLIRAPAVLI